MKLSRETPISNFEIWKPRYHDKVVLLAAFRVRAHNRVIITKDPKYKGLVFYLSGETIRKYKTERVNSLTMYAVHLDELEELTYGS